MVEVINLTKHYGSHAAVDGLSFTVRPGVATGFVGPDDAGKSTTMRMTFGLDTNTTLVSPAESPRADDLWAPNITLPRVIRSEWIKLRSVRSRIVTLGLTACAVIATGALVSMLGDGAPATAEVETIYDPAGSSSFGATIARLVLGALGALVITSAYSTGRIRTTLTAAMGAAFGALTRHTATAIGIVVATLFVMPTLFETLGEVWGRASEYLPGEVGEAMITIVRESGDMSPGTALIGWIGALLAAGTIALKRRDAEDRRPTMRLQRTVRTGVSLV